MKERVGESAKIVFHQTWAYQGDSDHFAFPDYSNDQLLMYGAIMKATRSVVRGDIDGVIPCGTAIQNARTSSIGDRLTRDGYHLDLNYGRYAAACTWFEALSGRSVVGNGYRPAGVDEKQRAIAQSAAHKAVRRPYRISKLR